MNGSRDTGPSQFCPAKHWSKLTAQSILSDAKPDKIDCFLLQKVKLYQAASFDGCRARQTPPGFVSPLPCEFQQDQKKFLSRHKWVK